MTRKYFSPKRSEAKHIRLMAESSGAMTYQWIPCKHGHSGERYSRGGGCVECSKKGKLRKPVSKNTLASLLAAYLQAQVRYEAAVSGEYIFVGRTCQQCGENKWYVAKGDCVMCRKLNNGRNKDE